MNDNLKKILSIFLGFLFINLITKSCNNFHIIKAKK